MQQVQPSNGGEEKGGEGTRAGFGSRSGSAIVQILRGEPSENSENTETYKRYCFKGIFFFFALLTSWFHSAQVNRTPSSDVALRAAVFCFVFAVGQSLFFAVHAICIRGGFDIIHVVFSCFVLLFVFVVLAPAVQRCVLVLHSAL